MCFIGREKGEIARFVLGFVWLWRCMDTFGSGLSSCQLLYRLVSMTLYQW